MVDDLPHGGLPASAQALRLRGPTGVVQFIKAGVVAERADEHDLPVGRVVVAYGWVLAGHAGHVIGQQAGGQPDNREVRGIDEDVSRAAGPNESKARSSVRRGLLGGGGQRREQRGQQHQAEPPSWSGLAGGEMSVEHRGWLTPPQRMVSVGV